MKIRFVLNDREVAVEVEPRTTLADCIRHQCRQTGTHVGCEHGVCGACTVLVDGTPVRSCLMFAAQADGARVTTVEGLSREDALSPLQAAFRKHHALQCGFCTPGMLLAAQDLIASGKKPGREEIRAHISGNYCRCTGYQAIVDAIEEVVNG